jgi:hypothetical protein
MRVDEKYYSLVVLELTPPGPHIPVGRTSRMGVPGRWMGAYGTREAIYRDADKSLARPTSRCILFDGENISFDASLVIYVKSTNIPPIMIINRIYKNQNLLSL